MIKVLFIFFFISFFHANTHHYQVEFMGINVAKVTMSHRDTVFANHPAIIVAFSANTQAVSSFFYPVDNHYEIIHSIDTHQILSFKKTTTQPGLSNQLFTDLKENLPYYHNSQISIPNNAITIFTLFHLMAFDLLEKESFIIEREGLHYEASLLKSPNGSHLHKNKLELISKSTTDKIGILEHTDIFTWAVFKENATRTIWVNTQEQRIEKCNFNVGLFSLTAEYLFTDE
ncbi:MAG: hypothetical protein H8E72_06535 [Candidatus Marinimicrobia bacterium]|nr:hypothetical protein [Candidatus Neomarinimicrobiota bacterium]